MNEVTASLVEFFAVPAYDFSHLPLKLAGTPLQLRVWNVLKNIPSGKTVTYGLLAKTLNSSPRAIGQAYRCNPVPLIVLCHRVVGQKILVVLLELGASLVQTKRWLLNHDAQ